MAISKYFIIINPTELAVLKSQAYSDKSRNWIGAGPDVAG